VPGAGQGLGVALVEAVEQAMQFRPRSSRVQRNISPNEAFLPPTSGRSASDSSRNQRM